MRRILLSLLSVTFLFGTWLFPPTRALWDALDTKAFFFFNNILENSTLAQDFWAFGNHSIFDWFHDVVMLSCFVIYIIVGTKEERIKRLSHLLITALVICLTVLCVKKIIAPYFITYLRESPTLQFKDVFRLSEEIDWMRVKDQSRCCFPGDHGVTACLFAYLTWNFMGWRVGLLTTSYAIFFCLPRIVSGAHFITDDVIGSLSIAIIATALVFGTPLAKNLLQGFENLFSRKKPIKAST